MLRSFFISKTTTKVAERDVSVEIHLKFTKVSKETFLITSFSIFCIYIKMKTKILTLYTGVLTNKKTKTISHRNPELFFKAGFGSVSAKGTDLQP
jgi:hypothetical protein